MNGITFIQPVWLWALSVVPVYFLLYWLLGRRQQRAMQKFSDAVLFKFLNPTLQVVGRKRGLRLLLMLAAVTLLALALARPGGNPVAQEEEVEQTGVDIMLLLDLSSSMRATDLKPSRLDATRLAVKYFIDQITQDRIGLIVFAGSVSMQSPLTQDYRTIKMMLDILSTQFLPVDGTAIGDVLKYALDRIGKENQKTAVMVLLTDGENTKGKPPLEILPEVVAAGTKVFTIGVGTKEGAMIPDGEDDKKRQKFKMYRGQPVVTKLDEPLLQKIAGDTGGKYFAAATSETLQAAYSEISRLTKTAHKEKKKKLFYQEWYVGPALAALALIFLEMFLSRRSRGPLFGRQAGDYGAV